jgi:GH24 family phage-related lysozyme (muramidase)
MADSRPQVNTQSNPQLTQVVARQQNYGVPQQRDSELGQLSRALGQFNPVLEQYGQVENAINETSAEKAGSDAALRSESTSTSVLDQPVPASVPPAYADSYKNALKMGIAQRHTTDTINDAVSQYNDLKGHEDFDPQSWLDEQRHSLLSGLPDKDMAAVGSQQWDKFEGMIHGDMEKVRGKRLDDIATATVSSLNGKLTADMTPGEVHDEILHINDQGMSLGRHSRKELFAYNLSKVQQLSTDAGGQPELFDALTNYKDSEGMTLADRNPEQVDNIAKYRAAAAAAREKGIEERAKPAAAAMRMDLETALKTDPASLLTPGFLINRIGKVGGLTADESVSYWSRALSAVEEKTKGQIAMTDYANGQGYLHPVEEQKKVMTQVTQPLVDALGSAIRGEGQYDPTAVAAQLVNAHVKAGVNVPADVIKNLFDVVGKTPPAAGAAPDAKFTTMAKLFAAMPPQFQEMYVTDEDSRKVLRNYQSSVAGGAEPAAAMQNAYAIVSPEAKAREADFKKSPEFATLKANAARNVQGSWGRLGFQVFNTYPSNANYMGAAAGVEATSFMQANPSSSDSDVENHIKSWASSNYVLDRTTGEATKVPQQLGGQGAQEAITAYTAKITKDMRLDDRNDGKWSVRMVPSPQNDGQYSTYLTFNGEISSLVGSTSLPQLLQTQRESKLMTEDDRAGMAEIIHGLQTNTLTADMLQTKAPLIAKAKLLHVLDLPQQQKLDAVRNTTMINAIQDLPKMDMGGSPSSSNLQLPATADGSKIDHSLTSQVATQLWGYGGYLNQAASLVTMGEGVALKAYHDPNPDAGMNIGMGYNLNANKATVDADLRRAKVPDERIEDVKAGRVSLTTDQAQRLLMVSLPRYESTAKSAVEDTAPGLWTKMQDRQKAALIDVAWQTGNPAQFKTALHALLNGDQQGFSDAIRVTYKGKDGERHDDSRRNNLRASMLAGDAQWVGVLGAMGNIPSNKLEGIQASLSK